MYQPMYLTYMLPNGINKHHVLSAPKIAKTTLILSYNLINNYKISNINIIISHTINNHDTIYILKVIKILTNIDKQS